MSKADTKIAKKTYAFGESCQEYQNSFSLDSVWHGELEERGPDCNHAVVFDPDKIEEFISAMAVSEQKAESEIKKYKTVSLTAFKHGCTFTGVMTGGLPYIQYQLEGTRVLSMASLKEVSRQVT